MFNQSSVTIRPHSTLLSEDLYQLESVFGQECSGHGAGGGGEDIHFGFPGDESCEMSINREGRTLTISVARFHRNVWSDIDLGEIPSPLRERLVELLHDHTEGPIPDELTGGV